MGYEFDNMEGVLLWWHRRIGGGGGAKILEIGNLDKIQVKFEQYSDKNLAKFGQY